MPQKTSRASFARFSAWFGEDKLRVQTSLESSKTAPLGHPIMKPRVFAAFVLPSIVMMLVFIAAPLASVFYNSFFQTKKSYETVVIESCTPGFGVSNCVTETKTQPILDENGDFIERTIFVGFENYRNVLELDRAQEAIAQWDFTRLLQFDFWSAMRFTLMFTFITLPLVVGFGMLIALAVNNSLQKIRGQVIFVSLLPFIITPVIGALSIRWLFVGDGIITSAMEAVSGQDIALFAQGWTVEILMVFYRVWHVAPFAFVVFYAGLQTVDQSTLESAVIDGASRFERLRYVVIPHLMPLIIFVTLIHLMDTYRVFEEIVGFRAEAYVTSFQYMTFDFLTTDQAGNRSLARASASAMLTMVGIVIILIPVLRFNWRARQRAA